MITDKREVKSREVVNQVRNTPGKERNLENLTLRTTDVHSFKKYFPHSYYMLLISLNGNNLCFDRIQCDSFHNLFHLIFAHMQNGI